MPFIGTNQNVCNACSIVPLCSCFHSPPRGLSLLKQLQEILDKIRFANVLDAVWCRRGLSLHEILLVTKMHHIIIVILQYLNRTFREFYLTLILVSLAPIIKVFRGVSATATCQQKRREHSQKCCDSAINLDDLVVSRMPLVSNSFFHNIGPPLHLRLQIVELLSPSHS